MRNEAITDDERERFDQLLESLLPLLPKRVRDVMEEVPVVVEDAPTQEVMTRMHIRHPAGLLGLYHGVPIDQRSVGDYPRLGDVVYLYRLGLINTCRRRDGQLVESRLREEIRKTLLHEIGHYHGMGEEELEDLGY